MEILTVLSTVIVWKLVEKTMGEYAQSGYISAAKAKESCTTVGDSLIAQA